VPGAIGPQIGVLDHVVGIRFVSREREREPVHVVDPWKRLLLEPGVPTS
jgi:hypothetical protein